MAAKRAARGVTSDDCVAALRRAFPAPQFALFEQVANGTGGHARRWADAIAMGIWPSRGLLIHGFEIKVNRPDWQRELKHPEKSEAVQRFCDRWHIVAPAGLIDASELPPTWGLIEVSEKGKTKTIVDAPALEAEPLTRQFAAAMLRRHHEVWGQNLAAEHARGLEEGARDGHGVLADRLKRAESALKDLADGVREFEDASGIKIYHGWKLGNVGEAVRVLTKARHHDFKKEMEADARRYEQTAKRIRDDIAKLQQAATGAGTEGE